jgi:hypothetical protein
MCLIMYKLIICLLNMYVYLLIMFPFNSQNYNYMVFMKKIFSHVILSMKTFNHAVIFMVTIIQ